MNDLKLFQITKEDKDHYKKVIQKIDVNNMEIIIKVLGEKIQKIINHGNLNRAEVILIEDMGKLSRILEENLDLPKLVIQKILFAMSYFIDENDEIPDIIPEYGYLDDLTVVNWIMEDIQKKLPEVANA
jgi:hypothetical protein|tara:strand:+ start:737 stop:1123 length:387 start_codon:yes stop_codon:yes gene_type:complete